MFYEETPEAMRSLVRTIGVVKKEQLLRFFSDCEDAINIEYYIRAFIMQREFDYDPKTDIIKWHTAPLIRATEEQLRISAFWIITSFRSKAIRQVVPVAYPCQFCFITEDNLVYDIAFCLTTTDAMIAQRRRLELTFEGVEDEVNHIMLVPDEATGEKLGAYGFDSYCFLDSSNRPQYRQWD